MSGAAYLCLARIALTRWNSNLIVDSVELLDNVVDLSGQVASVHRHIKGLLITKVEVDNQDRFQCNDGLPSAAATKPMSESKQKSHTMFSVCKV